MQRHARFYEVSFFFFFFFFFFPGVILKASYDKLMSICLHGRPAVEMLGGQKRDRTETIT